VLKTWCGRASATVTAIAPRIRRKSIVNLP
jgi:hypothetical protein